MKLNEAHINSKLSTVNLLRCELLTNKKVFNVNMIEYMSIK